jgi:hypothetical protein
MRWRAVCGKRGHLVQTIQTDWGALSREQPVIARAHTQSLTRKG